MGSYVKNSLAPGETVELKTTYHWIIFFTWRSLFTLGIVPLFHILVDEFAITNLRVIIKIGFIKRDTIELNLTKIEHVNFSQGYLGRVLGFGDVHLTGTGGSEEVFKRIKNPLAFRKKIQELC